MNNLRPDEIASNSQILRNQEQSQNAKRGLKTAVTIGSSLVGIGAASKIMPFLNDLIPVDLAIKGISKVAPQVGNFLKKGQKMGLNIQEGLQFIKDNIQPTQSQNPLQDFETNYPDIVQALTGHINNGRSPQESAAILKTSTPFSQKIKKIEKDTGKNFVDYILELMGGNKSSQMKKPQQTQQQVPQGAPGTPPPQQQQSGGLDPQLMQLMNGIRSSIQNIRGGNG